MVRPNQHPAKEQQQDHDDDEQQHYQLEEHQPPEIYSHVTMTENPFGESVWDHYQKVEKIDEGGTGEIWTVRKQDDDAGGDGRLYAVKMIDKNFLFGTFMKELRNEIEILRTIDHPNVVRILEVFENKDYMHLIMEHCSGGNLWSRSDYSEEDVANIMTQMLSAVALCHKQKMVHRDIKFENILFESDAKDSQVRLIDFGLSQRYRPPRGEYTMKLQVGTTYAIAPEVIEGKYTEKADVWSCGVVAYMLLSGGKYPFDAETKQGIPDVVKKGEYSMEGPEWKGVSQEAKEFVALLMKYNEEKRMHAEECLESDWLRKYSQQRIAPPQKVMRRVKDAILSYEDEPQLKRLAKMSIAHCAPADKLEKLREVFDSIDQSHDGTITCEEFVKALQDCEEYKGHLEELFVEVDQNETGVVNYTEFLSATLEAQGEIKDELLQEAFQKLDVDNCGSICKEGLSELMESKNLSGSGEELAEEILAEVDSEQEGKVNYEDFKEMFREDSSSAS